MKPRHKGDGDRGGERPCTFLFVEGTKTGEFRAVQPKGVFSVHLPVVRSGCQMSNGTATRRRAGGRGCRNYNGTSECCRLFLFVFCLRFYGYRAWVSQNRDGAFADCALVKIPCLGHAYLLLEMLLNCHNRYLPPPHGRCMFPGVTGCSTVNIKL